MGQDFHNPHLRAIPAFCSSLHQQPGRKMSRSSLRCTGQFAACILLVFTSYSLLLVASAFSVRPKTCPGPWVALHNAGLRTVLRPILSPRTVANRVWGSRDGEFGVKHASSGSANSRMSLSTSSSESDESVEQEDDKKTRAVALKEEAARVRLEAERMEAVLTLDKIDTLEKKLKSMDGTNDNDAARKKEDIRLQIESLAQKANPTVANTDGTPASRPRLSSEEIASAVHLYEKLPVQIRYMLLQAVGLDYSSNNSVNAADVVVKLYQNQDSLLSNPSSWANIKDVPTVIQPGNNSGDLDASEEVFNLMKLADITEQTQLERFVESFFPSSTRKPGQAPTERDTNLFMTDVLGAKTFNPVSKPERIPGGFVIRGENKMKDGQTMIEAIDNDLSRSPLKDKLQFFYVRDPTPEAMEDMEELWGQPLIVVLGKDFTPEVNRILLSVVSTTSLGLIFFFSISTFSQTEAVLQRLQNANALGEYDPSWFNELLLPLFLGILSTQFAHEVAHILIAWRDKFKTAVPVFLPSLFSLPFFGSATLLKTPPKSLSSLFDFGLAGPAAGMAVSLVLLATGIQSSLSMDPASVSYLPTLTVEFLQSSSLAGGIVDAGMGGGILELPDPSTATIPLHPLTIAGYVGMMINALNLLPIGNTDGGRMSVALFGRNGHILLQGLVFLVLFGAGLFGADKANILLTYGLFTFFTQRELEIPCRNEVDEVDFTRAAMAIAAWVTVALTLIPSYT